MRVARGFSEARPSEGPRKALGRPSKGPRKYITILISSSQKSCRKKIEILAGFKGMLKDLKKRGKDLSPSPDSYRERG